MEDLIKKFFYTGVGIVTLTAEKLQETVDEMVGQGKVSKEEGKKVVNTFMDKVDDKRGEMEGKVKEMAESFATAINLPKFATKEDLDTLITRIEALETKMAASTTTEVKEAVKKTATRAKSSKATS